MPELTKRQEALIRSLATRHGRRKTGLCRCEGVRCCQDVFQSHPELVELAVCADDLDLELPPVPTVRLPRARLEQLAATENTQGILAVVKRPDPPAQEPADPFLLTLDQVSDPGNFGTMIRTARAVGLREIWYTSGSVDPFGDKVIRSAMGSQFVVGMREYPDLPALLEAAAGFGYRNIYRTDVRAGANCFQESGLFERSVLIMGSEAHGAGAVENSRWVHIPMPGDAESLNVAQAATVLLFEYVRRTLH